VLAEKFCLINAVVDSGISQGYFAFENNKFLVLKLTGDFGQGRQEGQE